MKYAIIAARLLLALIFIVFSLNFWLHFITMPPPPDGSAAYLGLLVTSGYLAAVKVFELLGGLLMLSRRFAPFGLIILGPIVLNILFHDLFLAKGFNPVSTLSGVLGLFLVWAYRDRFAALVRS